MKDGTDSKIGQAKRELRMLYEELMVFNIHPPVEIDIEDDEAADFLLELWEYDAYIAPLLGYTKRRRDSEWGEKMVEETQKMISKLDQLIDEKGERPDLLYFRSYFNLTEKLVNRAIQLL